MNNYELHDLCKLFPEIEGDEFKKLCADIAANGLQNPIVLYEGKILDGRNRYAACEYANVEPDFVEYEGDNPAGYVLSINLHRRHLPAGVRAAIVASVQNWSTAHGHGGLRVSGQDAKLHLAPTELQTPSQLSKVADRAAEAGVSKRTQNDAEKVAKKNPELIKQVARGETKLSKAVEQVAPKKEKKQKSEESLDPLDHRDIVDALLKKKDDEIAGLKEELEIVKDGHLFAELPDDQRPTAEGTITALRVKLAMRENEIAAWKIKHNSLMAEHADLNGRHNGLVAIHKKCPKEKPKEEEYEPF